MIDKKTLEILDQFSNPLAKKLHRFLMAQCKELPKQVQFPEVPIKAVEILLVSLYDSYSTSKELLDERINDTAHNLREILHNSHIKQ